MHAWGVVDLKVYLAQTNHGYSISAQSYEFYLHLTQLDILEFTLSHIPYIRTIFSILNLGSILNHSFPVKVSILHQWILHLKWVV